MKDDPYPTQSTIRSEWALLLHSFLDEDSNPVEIIDRIRMDADPMTLDEVQSLKKKLSDERKLLNLRVEAIKEQLESNSQILANLELVGSNTEEILAENEALHAEGEEVTEKLASLGTKIKKLHDLQDALLIHQQEVS